MPLERLWGHPELALLRHNANADFNRVSKTDAEDERVGAVAQRRRVTAEKCSAEPSRRIVDE
jgi:hypothetical protein